MTSLLDLTPIGSPVDQTPFAVDLARMVSLIGGQDARQTRKRAEAVLALRQSRSADLPCALATLGVIAWREGRMVDALGLLRAAVARADGLPPQSARRSYPRLPLALVLATVGELALADAAVDECREEIEHAGGGALAAAPLLCCAFVHFASGRLPEARADTEKAEAIADECRDPVLAGLAAQVLGLVELHEADVWPDACTGEPDDRVVLPLTLPGISAILVRTALAAGDRGRAEQIVLVIERVAAENFGLPALDAAARHARGLLEESVSLLLEAAHEHRHPLAQAAAHEDAGAILAQGDRSAAQAEFKLALTAFRRAGADRAAERVRLRLEDLSMPERCHRRDQPRWGWASLTPTENQVAAVVAEGLTNAKVAERMYRSRHTIDFHLRQIYRKLGISSRVELTRLVLEHAA